MAGNITSANATAVMVVDTLFPVGFELKDFATDQAITQAEETIAETRMGVDGHMAAGFVPSIKSVTVTLEPFSPSIDYLEAVYSAMNANKTTYNVTMIVSIPSIGKVYTYTGGVMKTPKTFPDLKKVLDPQSFAFDYEEKIISKL